ncbi:hypothetical protein [Parathermosynechococcus lividus]
MTTGFLSQIWVDKMLVCDAKLQGTKDQYERLDQALRTGLFVRNKALRYWMDGQGKRTADLNKYCRVLAKEYPWAKKLNSLAERAWPAISRFDNNCKQKVKGKTGCPNSCLGGVQNQQLAKFI